MPLPRGPRRCEQPERASAQKGADAVEIEFPLELCDD
jgi:hypothetical protein